MRNCCSYFRSALQRHEAAQLDSYSSSSESPFFWGSVVKRVRFFSSGVFQVVRAEGRLARVSQHLKSNHLGLNLAGILPRHLIVQSFFTQRKESIVLGPLLSSPRGLTTF